MSVPKLYSAKEIAEAWGTSESWVLEHVPSLKLGGFRRFSEQAIEAYIAEQNSEGAGLAEVRELRGVSG